MPLEGKRGSFRKTRVFRSWYFLVMSSSFFVLLLQRCPKAAAARRRPVSMLVSSLTTCFVPPCTHPSAFHIRKQKAPSQFAIQSRTATFATKTTTTSGSGSSSRPYKLVIVESPSKCKTIEAILQKYVKEHNLEFDFKVSSSMGHVRNLPQTSDIAKSKRSSAKAKDDTTTSSSPFPYRIVGIDLENNYKPTYVLLPDKRKTVRDLQDLALNAQQVLLAPDPDREGEAIAWHLQEVLFSAGEDHNPSQQPPARITFSEITPRAVIQAIEEPKLVNMALVNAQETRRVLDRLAGFTVSPILWKKIAPGLSAGRVQSVGMAMVVRREVERLRFQPVEYWDLHANFSDPTQFSSSSPTIAAATLYSVNGTVIASGKADFHPNDDDAKAIKRTSKKLHVTAQIAKELTDTLTQLDPSTGEPLAAWSVHEVKARERRQFPPLPFKTSTLQQDSNGKLGFSVSQTMRTAQQLYEQGLISYMRTDSTHISDDGHQATEWAVTQTYGPQNLAPRSTDSPKHTKKDDTSFAQEAHEAIRPAIQPNGSFLSPEEVQEQKSLHESSLRLYDLIYKRTLASRMPPQVLNQTTMTIQGVVEETQVHFRASGSVILKPGYTLAIGRSSDESSVLPKLTEGQCLDCSGLEPQEHHTQPPPRYTEASLVKELEANGVGRPSTYAGTVQILRDRAYVGTTATSNNRSNRRSKTASGPAISAQRAAGGGEEFLGGGGARGSLVPSLSAFVVYSLLEKHCPNYVDTKFTAQMEGRLDDIATSDSSDEQQRVKYLNEFYAGEDGLAARVKRIDDHIEADEARRATLPALMKEDGDHTSNIGLFVGPWGPYIQELSKDEGSEKKASASLPPSMATDLSSITSQSLSMLLTTRQKNGDILGEHPEDGRNIRLKIGRYGAYLQLGEDGEEGTTTHGLPKHLSAVNRFDVSDDNTSLGNMMGLSFEDAVAYVGLPRTVCMMDEKPVVAALGPYGPYLKYNGKYTSLNAKDGDVLSIEAEAAQRVVTEGIINAKSKSSGIELGEKDGSMVCVKTGRYGLYIKWNKINAALPNEFTESPEDIPLEEAWALIQAKAESSAGKKKTRNTGSKNEVDLPPQPKRPLSAYLHFCAEKRPEVAVSKKSLGDISKTLAELWASTSAEDRVPFEELAKTGKEEYSKKKEEWQQECQSLLDRAGVEKQGTISKPKRAKSAYLYFCEANRPEVSKTVKRLGHISKELARRWHESTDRSQYEALAVADKARYAKEMEKGEESFSSSPKTQVKRRISISTSSGRAKKGQASRKGRSPSAYMLFCREKRPEIVDSEGNKLPLGESTKRLAKMWNESNDDDKAKFFEQAKREKEATQA